MLVSKSGLADKRAETIATSLDSVMRRACTAVGDAVPATLPVLTLVMYFFVHILVGDGIYTNAKSARLLWAAALVAPSHVRMRYLLLVVICASHRVVVVVLVIRRNVLCRDRVAERGFGLLQLPTYST